MLDQHSIVLNLNMKTPDKSEWQWEVEVSHRQNCLSHEAFWTILNAFESVGFELSECCKNFQFWMLFCAQNGISRSQLTRRVLVGRTFFLKMRFLNDFMWSQEVQKVFPDSLEVIVYLKDPHKIRFPCFSKSTSMSKIRPPSIFWKKTKNVEN